MQDHAIEQVTYHAVPYAPDGGLGILAALPMMLMLLAAGVVVGTVAYFVSQLFWIVLIFPSLVGFAMGAVGRWAARRTKLRNSFAGSAAGLLGGLAAMFMMHYTGYQEFHRTIESLPPEMRSLAALPEQQRWQAMTKMSDADRENAMGILGAMNHDSFMGYMDMKATKGVTVGHGGTSGFNLGYGGSWIYWAVEVVVAAIIARVMVRRMSRRPFCVSCNRWKQPRCIGGFRGTATGADAALASGSLAAIRRSGFCRQGFELALVAHVCPQCGREGTAELQVVAGEPIVLHTYPADAVWALEQLGA